MATGPGATAKLAQRSAHPACETLQPGSPWAGSDVLSEDGKLHNTQTYAHRILIKIV